MTEIRYDRMACSTIADGAAVSGPVVQASGGPYAAGSAPAYYGQIVTQTGAGIPAADISVLTLSIVDTLTGAVINNASQVNILNTGRGTVDASGNLVVQLETGDTSLSEEPGATAVQRSLVLDWTYAIPLGESGSGRHQVNFVVVALAGP